MTKIDIGEKDKIKRYDWKRPNPFVSAWTIENCHIDHYRHTNNVAYLTQLESLAWQHSNYLGLGFSDYQAADTAMVIARHELFYHQASHLHDELFCATWISECDNKCRLSREFQFINRQSKKTVFSAQTDFICVSLSSGRPKRMPDLFTNIYGNALS